VGINVATPPQVHVGSQLFDALALVAIIIGGLTLSSLRWPVGGWSRMVFTGLSSSSPHAEDNAGVGVRAARRDVSCGCKQPG
jgi:hypothetical protein